MEHLLQSFSSLPDFRINRHKLHDLTEIIFISICAVICGCDDYVSIKSWADDNIVWLRQYLVLAHGIPSDDTFRRIFRFLDYEAFNRCFMDFTNGLSNLTEGEVISFDGKCLRGSKDKKLGKVGVYMMGAWASQNKLLLGQLKVDEKTNEMIVMPQLLEILFIKGCIVTTDALNCQKVIAEKIIEKEADYILAVKGNHPILETQIIQSFELETPTTEFISHDKDHGRMEKRTCQVLTNLSWIDQKEEWKNLTSIVKVVSERTIISENKTSIDTRYFICNQAFTAEKMLASIRNHWAIENQLHWSLDVTFDEDRKRNRKDNSAVNTSFLKRITLNLIKQEPTKMSIAHKRLKANRSPEFLDKIINIKK
ncbi:MAG: ISAs1 family transposase [Arcicella sp.]|nr:ISAs1 family transposase [Arcicella sp.]